MEHDPGSDVPSFAAGDAPGRGDVLSETGEHRVDGALRALAELADRPVSEHPQIFERIHGQLVEVLGELRSGAESAGPANPNGT
ncbi:MAG TPA: hypothetical protein VNF47_08500 [Streptosporangiaceae bacterium]|nr:hypothetical protein [Streptosporangiaceae bacterium]